MDFGYPSLSSSTIVRIEVPINKPVTIAPSNIFHVSEGVKIGTKVGSVNATDPDGALGSNQTLWYVLIDKDGECNIYLLIFIILLKNIIDVNHKFPKWALLLPVGIETVQMGAGV